MEMFTLFQILVLIDGIFMWTLIGQGLLGVLIGAKKSENVVYRFMHRITNPVWWLTRVVTPRFVSDRYIGIVAVALLILLRIILYIIFAYHGWIPSIAPQ